MGGRSTWIKLSPLDESFEFKLKLKAHFIKNKTFSERKLSEVTQASMMSPLVLARSMSKESLEAKQTLKKRAGSYT